MSYMLCVITGQISDPVAQLILMKSDNFLFHADMVRGLSAAKNLIVCVTMKRTILIIVILLLAAVGVGTYYLLTNLDYLVKSAIEKYGSQTVQTAVRVDSVNINLADAQAALSGMTVANPSGFAKRPALSLSGIGVAIDIKNTRRDLITINRINIDNPQIYFEINQDRKNNLSRLKKNLAVSATAPGRAKDDSEESSLRLHIRELHFSGAQVQALLIPLNNKQGELKIPALRMSNLKGTPRQISRQILDTLLDHVQTEVKKSRLAAEIDRLKQDARQKVEQEKTEIQEKAQDKLDAEKRKAEEKLRRLLN